MIANCSIKRVPLLLLLQIDPLNTTVMIANCPFKVILVLLLQTDPLSWSTLP